MKKGKKRGQNRKNRKEGARNTIIFNECFGFLGYIFKHVSELICRQREACALKLPDVNQLGAVTSRTVLKRGYQKGLCSLLD